MKHLKTALFYNLNVISCFFHLKSAFVNINIILKSKHN